MTEPGRNSPYRDRPVAENLDLFRRMRAGEFADGSRTLRAKIDMAAPNINLRDPVMYRVDLHGMDNVKKSLETHQENLKNQYVAEGCEAQLGKR